MSAGILEEAIVANNSTTGKAEAHIRIGDLAREFDVTLRALRFYEAKGLIKPKRRGVTRFYTQNDRMRLKLILLGRKIGFRLREIKQILEICSSESASEQQLQAFLQKSEKQMEWLERRYVEIEEAVTGLAGLITMARARLARKNDGAVPEPSANYPKPT